MKYLVDLQIICALERLARSIHRHRFLGTPVAVSLTGEQARRGSGPVECSHLRHILKQTCHDSRQGRQGKRKKDESHGHVDRLAKQLWNLDECE